MFKRLATLLLGIGLIGLGVLFFLAPERAQITHLLMQFWPLFLVLAGLVRVTGYLIDRHPPSPVGGIMITAIGGILLAANLRGGQSLIEIFGNYWFWLLVAFVSGRVLRQYAHRVGDGPRPRAFTPGAIFFMLLIVGGGLAANYLVKNSRSLDGVNLRVAVLGGLRDYLIPPLLSIEDEPPQLFTPLLNSKLVITNPTGDIEIATAPQAQASARIVKRIRALNEQEAKQVAQEIKLQVTPDGKDYRITVNTSGVRQDVDTPIMITLPQNIEIGVEVSDASGLVKLSGLRGNHTIRDSNRLEVSDQTGKLTIENLNGSIQLDRIHGDVNLINASDGIILRDVTGVMTLDIKDGGVSADRVNGSLRIKADDGDVEVENAEGPTTIETTSDVTVRNFRGSLIVTSRHGSINLSTNEKITADVKADVEKGRIRFSLPEDCHFRLDAAASQGQVKVKGFEQFSLPHGEGSFISGHNISDSSPLIRLRTNNGGIQVKASGLMLASREDE